MKYEVGYPNEKMDMAVITIDHALVTNPWPHGGQFIVTIENAMELRDALDEFLLRHRQSSH